MELSDLQRLAVADVLQKAMRETTNPHGGRNGADTLRTKADDELRELHDKYGVDRLEISIAGTKVGTLSLRTQDAKVTHRLAIRDINRLCAWYRDPDNAAALTALIRKNGVDDALAETGEVPDGTEVETVREPACVLGTTLRTDRDAVVEAVGGLPGAAAALLEEGGE